LNANERGCLLPNCHLVLLHLCTDFKIFLPNAFFLSIMKKSFRTFTQNVYKGVQACWYYRKNINHSIKFEELGLRFPKIILRPQKNVLIENTSQNTAPFNIPKNPIFWRVLHIYVLFQVLRYLLNYWNKFIFLEEMLLIIHMWVMI